MEAAPRFKLTMPTSPEVENRVEVVRRVTNHEGEGKVFEN